MVQKFGSWTALFVARPLVQYRRWGEPIRSILDEIVPPGAPEITQNLLRQACPVISIFDTIWDHLSFLVVPIMSLVAKLFPTAPILDIFVCLRKRYFHDRVVEAIERGAKQVLILGGGYDVLMINLAPRYPNVLFVEVDHPSTSIYKRAAFEKLSYKYPNAHFFPVDLSVWKLEDKIFYEYSSWNKEAKSVVIAEGLFMYLTLESVRQCLRSMKAITAPGSTLVFSYLVKTMPLLASKAMLNIFGEPMLWIADSSDEVINLVSNEGFSVDISPKQSDNYQQYLAKYGRLPCFNFYQDQNGIAISK